MGSLMDIRRRILQGAESIPPTYQRVDYLQSTGGKARIDTGIAGNDSTIQIAGEVAALDFGAYNAFLGNHTSDNYRSWRVMQPGSASNNYIFFGTYLNNLVNVNIVSKTWAVLPVRFSFLIKYGYAEATVDGVTLSVTRTDSGLAENGTHIAIGSRIASAGSGAARHRFYGIKIWRQGSLVRDYVPCVRRSDSVAGFYDRANHTFSPSTGTEAFVAGYDS